MTLPTYLSKRLDRTSSPHGCWMWTGRVDANGVGRVDVPGGPRGAIAHRVVYEALVGPIPAGLVLLHHCDELNGKGIAGRRCCRPDPQHLAPGTHRENAEDRHRKGRSARQLPKAPNAPSGRRDW